MRLKIFLLPAIMQEVDSVTENYISKLKISIFLNAFFYSLYLNRLDAWFQKDRG